MRLRALLLGLLTILLLGCGGGGGGGGTGTVTNSQFQVIWPARSRDGLHAILTSAMSARIVLHQAGVGQTDVTLNIDRDSARPTGYTGTYTIPQQISPSSLGSITATFFSLASQGGDVVGTATSTATLVGNTVQFAPIVLTGTITQVTSTPVMVKLGIPSPVQLLFSALDNTSQVVAVTPGSAAWAIADGGQFISLTPDGMVTPLAEGTAHVTVSVDGINSLPVPIDVATELIPVYTWSGAKGGTLTSPTFDAVEGNKFTVTGGKNVLVLKLGYEATPGGHPSGTTAIFDSNGNVLASALVSSSDPLFSGYYYHDIAPLTLVSGATYYIGSLHGTGDSWIYYHNTNTANTPPYIVDLGTWFKVSSTIEGGSWQDAVVRHYVGNFQAQQVP